MSLDFDKSRTKTISGIEFISSLQNWSLRNVLLPGAVLLLIVLGWYIVLRQTEILTQTTIAAYQQAELAIVRAAARSVKQYVSEQVEAHGRTEIVELEQEIFEHFIAPIHLLKNGDAWIYAPDHVVFDLSSDFPQAYRGKSMAQIFALQAENGASHYEEMTEAVMTAREGVGWYIWLPDKGQEIAAWTPVSIGNLVWTIGLSTPLPEIMESTGAASQIRTSIIIMALGTVVALASLIAWVTSTTRRKQAEAALAEEHGLLRTFMDNIPNAIYVKDTESRFLIANKVVADLMGTTSDKLIGQTDFDFYAEELAKLYYADEQAVVTSGQALINKEEFNIDHTGNQRWLSTTKAPFRDSQGKVKGLVGIGRDITERKQMEQALQKAHAELEARVEQRTAELTKANEQLAALYRVGQIITTPLRLNMVLDVITRSTAQLLETDTGVILLLDEAEETLTIKGAYGLSERVIEGTHDRVGESIAGRVVQTGQPIIANDLPNDSRFYNPAVAKEEFLACASVPLVVGGKIVGTLDVHSKVNRHAFTEAHIQILKMLASQAAIAIENAQLYEEVQRARDELEERVRRRTVALIAANEQLHQEITERKRAEMEREALIAELEAKNDELERFTYTVSHDLKSPLITIQGFLGYVERAAISGDIQRVQADLARITNAADKMQRLLNELLELSRIGRLMNPPEAIPLDGLVREAVDLVAGRLAERGAEVYIAPNLPLVYGDRPRLREALQNLLDNAVKYMGEQAHPRVEIGVRYDGPKTVIYVRDNGIGLDPSSHDEVFGLFTKLDQKSEGTGLGLAIAKRIVEAHGGRIWVESDGVGRGSAFCLTLPDKIQRTNKEGQNLEKQTLDHFAR